MMGKGYVIVGKFNDEHVKKMFNNEKDVIIEEKSLQNKKILKGIIVTVLMLTVSSMLGDTVHANPYNEIENSPDIKPVLEFIDWLVYMLRWIFSSVLGLIATYAGYRWGTDISSSGVTEAKKILKNAAIGLFWVQFGASVVNFVLDKLQSFV